jgi:hypothetical protein
MQLMIPCTDYSEFQRQLCAECSKLGARQLSQKHRIGVTSFQAFQSPRREAADVRDSAEKWVNYLATRNEGAGVQSDRQPTS